MTRIAKRSVHPSREHVLFHTGFVVGSCATWRWPHHPQCQDWEVFNRSPRYKKRTNRSLQFSGRVAHEEDIHYRGECCIFRVSFE